MRKATHIGSCALCNTEIFSFVNLKQGRALLPNGSFREVGFRIESDLAMYNGSRLRAAFCDECYEKLAESQFPELMENIADGVRFDTDRLQFKDEAAKHIHLGCFLSRKIVQFCSCKQDNPVEAHQSGKCLGQKLAKRMCTHCWKLYWTDEDHASVCEVIQKDLKETQI